jgi:prevent-host-death family protein
MLQDACARCTFCDVVITLTEARRKLGRLITQARISGENVTVTDRGEPVAMLVPMVPPRPAEESAPPG